MAYFRRSYLSFADSISSDVPFVNIAITPLPMCLVILVKYQWKTSKMMIITSGETISGNRVLKNHMNLIYGAKRALRYCWGMRTDVYKDIIWMESMISVRYPERTWSSESILISRCWENACWKIKSGVLLLSNRRREKYFAWFLHPILIRDWWLAVSAERTTWCSREIRWNLC